MLRLGKMMSKPPAASRPHQRVIGATMKFAMMTKLSLLAVVIFLSSLLWAADAPAGAAIDPQKSSITVRVLKAGVFSAFGHEHEIIAPMQQGPLTAHPTSVELTVHARAIRVVSKAI